MQIELTKPHRHDGRDLPAGAALDLAPAQAKWLISLGRAKPAPAALKTTTPAAKE